jgi:hypothetical protein
MAVVKVRGSAHSKELRAFEITEEGLVMGEKMDRYEGLLTGSPEWIANGPSKKDGSQPRKGHVSRPTRR